MLKPQDIVVMMKLLSWPKDKSWRYIDLASALDMSPSEVHGAINRATECHLYDPLTQRPNTAAMLEFLQHGLKYIFPASPGAKRRGIPTAHSTAPLSKMITSDDDEAYVWPSATGTMRGQAIEPLYKTVPLATAKDKVLHELLGLVDAIRIGRPREVKLAIQELQKRFKK